MCANDFPLCLRNFFGEFFQPVIVTSIEAYLLSVFHMAMICISQVCLGRGVCILFQKGTSAYWSWSDGMEPNNLQTCRNLRWSDA